MCVESFAQGVDAQVTWQATDTFAWQQGGTRSELVAVLGVGSFGQMSENVVFGSNDAEW